ncbi:MULTISPECIES: adaptor protein MecA [Leuconostoc]|uniref:Adaptor protein MecA n=1 Tax=Leuconostoc pseudomesenteroides TaxID=33968 RepID=A0A1X0VD02_LEUPS|nr:MULTISPECIES: adaptor protein MecA [Leuconostoc]KDA48274.1 Negative regulator of genetic competence MecA [Leuconostoc pseudomesenteroides 1159]KDA50188.1 Negative regulator of genetic competence MecA [Leuconostoc pseudomesenteroides PS12]MCT4419471.1 adaptor protein MecA [Leuconostoc falkenbergense]MDG9744551.1 adaptor protein MecA [Leuconostoc falkenbergense]OQJ68835.1 adaptor protein MecA [Leuconostoc pseudomesenteroides]
MERERINENTIRVMINNSDLEDRGISVMELLGNHDKIESFFYNILSEVDTEHDFDDDDQVSFQILPNRNGLELFISRLDSENQVGDILNNIMDFANKKNSDIDDISDERRTELRQSDDGSVKHPVIPKKSVTKSSNSFEKTITIKLFSFESAIAIAKTFDAKNFISDLYRYDNTFFLQLTPKNDDFSWEELKDKLAIVFEYGNLSDVNNDVLKEHGEPVMVKNAVDQLNQLF